jgi:hypothetical protein
VRDVVADYSERSVNSALPPIVDAESVVRDVLDRVAGFGPLQQYLDDPEIEEIWVNEPGRVFVASRGRSELTTTILASGASQGSPGLPGMLRRTSLSALIRVQPGQRLDAGPVAEAQAVCASAGRCRRSGCDRCSPMRRWSRRSDARLQADPEYGCRDKGPDDPGYDPESSIPRI